VTLSSRACWTSPVAAPAVRRECGAVSELNEENGALTVGESIEARRIDAPLNWALGVGWKMKACRVWPHLMGLVQAG
jgi:hypothetical protein